MTAETSPSDGKPFRLFCVSDDHAAIAGGAPAVVDQLTRRVAAAGHPVDLLFARKNPMPIGPGVEATQVLPSTLGLPWGWNPKLRERILGVARRAGPTVMHLHGIWTAPQYLAAQTARGLSMPFIVSAHGMLEPWLWDRQGWRIKLKKQAYWKLCAKPAFTPASVVHAITPLERDHLHALLPSNRIEVIPNAIDLNQYPIEANSTTLRQRLIVFIGRIEEKKGVDILLRAFAAARLGSDWRVAIIGPVWSQTYQTKLERIVMEEGIEDRVLFLGAVFGPEKQGWIRKAWVIAVPSHSEVVGLVNLEAAAHCTPTITTHQTGLFDWESGGGLLIQPKVDDLYIALRRACAWDDIERRERGDASRDLLARRYSWNVVLPQWLELYQSLASGR